MDAVAGKRKLGVPARSVDDAGDELDLFSPEILMVAVNDECALDKLGLDFRLESQRDPVVPPRLDRLDPVLYEFSEFALQTDVQDGEGFYYCAQHSGYAGEMGLCL